MALYTDEGVVLRTAKLGEADRIITLFTRMHGAPWPKASDGPNRGSAGVWNRSCA